MGLFDYIKCEMTLPDGSVDTVDQTKEFACMMVTHRIDKDGQLWLADGQYEDVPKEDRTYPDAPDDSFLSMAGCMKWAGGFRKSDWTGMLGVGDYDLHFLKGKVAIVEETVYQKYNLKVMAPGQWDSAPALDKWVVTFDQWDKAAKKSRTHVNYFECEADARTFMEQTA